MAEKEWKNIEWNGLSFYFKESINNDGIKQPLENKTKSKIKMRGINRGPKNRTTIIMLRNKKDLIGVSEIYWGDDKAKISERDSDETKNPELMEFPNELLEITEILRNKFATGHAYQVRDDLQGQGYGRILMFFMLSYLKHKNVKTMMVSGYANNPNNPNAREEVEKKYLRLGARRIDDNSSIFENFPEVLSKLGAKISKDKEEVVQELF